jgi:hypothetical protein
MLLLLMDVFIFVLACEQTKTMYDHAGTSRNDFFPGGPDTYRSICYQRDEANGFRVKDPKKEESVREPVLL